MVVSVLNDVGGFGVATVSVLMLQELRKKAGGGVTTDGRVFVRTKAELNRLEALRRVMAERSFRMLQKGPSAVGFISRETFVWCLLNLPRVYRVAILRSIVDALSLEMRTLNTPPKLN